MKRKLLVTASTFPRWEGDTEPRFVLDLAAHMTDEYDVTVLAPAAPGAAEKEVLEGVKVIRYHYFPIHKWETLCYPGAIVPRIKEKRVRALLVPFLLISLWWHLLKILPDFDIVHAHWLIPQGIVQSFFKKTYIVTGHGGDVTSLNNGFSKKMKIHTLKRASKVTVVSDYLKKQVQKLVPECNPAVVSMGVDSSKFGKCFFKENYFEQGDKKVILFVGRLAEKKGVAYLIEAMKYVDAILIIAGDGPLKNSLMQQAKEQGSKIRFIGSKTHEELKTIYASADVFCCPSITAKDGDMEGVPTTIMEAMASGVPVIASNSAGISQIVRDGENGLLCEEKNATQLAEKINTILNNGVLKEKLLIGAENIVEEYSYKSIAGRYKTCIKEV